MRYTFILAHYNQYQYIFTAIDSVLLQNYTDIEIIVMDDCSVIFSKEEVEEYIHTHKRENIKSVQVLVNEENIGTVRSMNRALKTVTGSLVQLFAADDRLHDADVAKNFVTAFEKSNKDAKVICASAMLMDEALTPPGHYHFPLHAHHNFNGMDTFDQYRSLVFSCVMAMGATCVWTEFYREIGFFNERYKYVEDWPFYISITRNGKHINTTDFVALDHRDGGISRTNQDPATLTSVGYQHDILETMETEILPYLSMFPVKVQHDLIERYYSEHRMLQKIKGTRRKWRWFDFYKFSKKVVVWRFLAKWRWNNGRFIKRSLISMFAALVVLLLTEIAEVAANIGGNISFPYVTALLDACFVISAIILLCATVFMAANIAIWIGYRLYKFIKEQRA